MTSSKSLNSANRPLVLLSAAFLLQAGGSLATAHAGDVQTQARELLSQTTVGRSVAAQANALSDGTSLAAPDAQEQARRLILGADGEAHVSALRYAKPISPAEVAAQDHGRVHADAQDMARRMLLGAVL